MCYFSSSMSRENRVLSLFTTMYICEFLGTCLFVFVSFCFVCLHLLSHCGGAEITETPVDPDLHGSGNSNSWHQGYMAGASSTEPYLQSFLCPPPPLHPPPPPPPLLLFLRGFWILLLLNCSSSLHILNINPSLTHDCGYFLLLGCLFPVNCIL